MSLRQKYKTGSSRLNRILFAIACGVPIFSTIAFGAVDIWALGILAVVFAVALLLWGIDSWLCGKFVFSSNPLQFAILGMILIGCVQLLPLRTDSAGLTVPAVRSLSLAPYATRFAIIQLSIYLIFFALMYFLLRNEVRVRRLMYLIIGFGALMAFFGILQRLASSDQVIYGLRNSFQANPFGPFVNQHHFATFMVLTSALPLALLFGKATRKDKRALLLISVIIMGIAILLTSSRGAFLGLLGSMGFIIAANLIKRKNDRSGENSSAGVYRRNLAFVGSGLALIILMLGIGLYLTNDTTLDRVFTMQTGTEDISNGRTHFWSVGWQIFKDHPVIGSGLDSYGTAFPTYDSWNGQYRLERAHNDYLQTLSDTGILGFFCVAGFIFLLFKQGFRAIANSESNLIKNIRIGSLAGCFGVLIHSFFDFPLRTPSNMFFFLTLAVFATAGVHQRSEKRKSNRITEAANS